MRAKRITLVRGEKESYMALYVNGKKVTEGCTLTATDVLEALDADWWVIYQDEFPERLPHAS